MILPRERDPRPITVRRGGTLTDFHHHLLGSWAAVCAEHVLHHFEAAQPSATRPRVAIDSIRAWTRGEIRMMDCPALGGHAMAAARDLRGAARHAAYATGQAACVAHVAERGLGAAAYAIKAVRATASGLDDPAGRLECEWQRDQLPPAIREIVIDDQPRRNDLCWSVFDRQPRGEERRREGAPSTERRTRSSRDRDGSARHTHTTWRTPGAVAA